MKFFTIQENHNNIFIKQSDPPLYLSSKFIKEILNENFNLDKKMDCIVYSPEPLRIEASHGLKEFKISHRQDTFHLYMIEHPENILINGQYPVFEKNKKLSAKL